MDEVDMQLRLAGHVAKSDACALNQIYLVLLSRVKEVDERLNLRFLSFAYLNVFNSSE